MSLRARHETIKSMEVSTSTIMLMGNLHFTDGEILISTLLLTIIILYIFDITHHRIIGLKIKKNQYD